MTDSYLRWNLQMFAGDGGAGGGEGAGAPGGEAADTGENAVDAGQRRLMELGVPADKIRKNRAYKSASVPQAQPQQGQPEEKQAAAVEDNAQQESAEKAPARMTWDEIMADPEYNKQMQQVVQGRLRGAKASEEALKSLTPALEVLARRYNLDQSKIDYAALAAAVENDDEYYEEKALEMGVGVDTAKKIDREERAGKRAQQEAEETLEQQRIQQHFNSLVSQGEKLKAVFPKFDLAEELKNPTFARLTAPSSGLSLEDAYYAVHRKEIQEASVRITAQKTAQQISNSIQAGQRRPIENGSSGQTSPAQIFDYSKATPAQREALKQRIRNAAARGEKIYPGSF